MSEIATNANHNFPEPNLTLSKWFVCLSNSPKPKYIYYFLHILCFWFSALDTLDCRIPFTLQRVSLLLCCSAKHKSKCDPSVTHGVTIRFFLPVSHKLRWEDVSSYPHQFNSNPPVKVVWYKYTLTYKQNQLGQEGGFAYGMDENSSPAPAMRPLGTLRAHLMMGTFIAWHSFKTTGFIN